MTHLMLLHRVKVIQWATPICSQAAERKEAEVVVDLLKVRHLQRVRCFPIG